MDTKSPAGEFATHVPPPKWRTLIRQHSEKINILAEDVVLPKNQRLIRQASRIENLPMENIGPYTSNDPYILTVKSIEPPSIKESLNFPVFMVGISIIQVVLMYAADESLLFFIFGLDPYRRHELWRYLTMMLAHSGYSHLWSNVFLQSILGVLLEMIHHWKRITIIYLASVLGGSLFITVLHSTAYTVGASSGVYGLLFSHLSTIIINWNEMDRKFFRVFLLFLYIAFDIGINLYSELVAKKDSHTSHAGHIGGAITGFLVSILVLKNFEEHPWEKKMQKICIVILIAICVIIVVVNVTAWGNYYSTEWNVQYAATYVKHIYKVINGSATLTKLCEADSDCISSILKQYKFNSTIPI